MDKIIEIKLGDITVYPEVIPDEFSGIKSIVFKQLHRSGEYFIRMWGEDAISPEVSFKNVSGRDYIVFRCWKSEYKLRQGDTIYFLFESGEII